MFNFKTQEYQTASYSNAHDDENLTLIRIGLKFTIIQASFNLSPELAYSRRVYAAEVVEAKNTKFLEFDIRLRKPTWVAAEVPLVWNILLKCFEEK